VLGMPALDASAPARDAIDEFLRHLAGRDLSASTRRIRKTFLNEYLRHAQQAAGAEKQLTARDLLDGERAAAWLADAAEGKTRTRNTLRGPDAAAYPNSMRVRADTVNAFAEFLGEPARVDRQAPARGYHLTPGDTERLLHDLTVKRPIHANAMTALRTAAVASVIADTGHGVPEIADLKLSALHLDGDEARIELDGESFPLTRSTVHVLTRWLAARGSIIAELEGSDPGYLWIPTKPGRPRGGVPSAKPGISPAAVRTLHASHRALVSQLLGTPLRPGALRAAAAASIPGTDQELDVLLRHADDAERVRAGEGGLILVDPGIDGSDLNQFADDLDRLGIPVVAGFSTHPHWDHLLWHSRFGDVPRHATTAAARAASEARERGRKMAADCASGIPLELLGLVTPAHGRRTRAGRDRRASGAGRRPRRDPPRGPRRPARRRHALRRLDPDPRPSPPRSGRQARGR
jgi:site-specific recombinase XerD